MPSSSKNPSPTNSVLTRDQALRKAFEKAGVTADDVLEIECELDNDDGKTVYEIEFETRDGVEYSCDVDIHTGSIYDFDKDRDDDRDDDDD
ncbi:MAG: PepSY domain-containing protein [Clostridia bacterium]|nr:PepSY domain-containing protein [Clostridia bacterium]